jgi:SAM-dependent methyltransferase
VEAEKSRGYGRGVTYVSPLAYLLGLEGAALLRGMREGSADREFVEARIDEIRGLLEAPALAAAEGVTAEPGAIGTGEVYAEWAPHYDGPNTMIDVEQPIVWDILDGLPAGIALDAACGTGRHAARLAELGHHVIGIDASPEMLAQARKRMPDGDFREADLRRIPLPDNAVDTLVCGLALTYVSELAPVMAEFARVLRPGGHLVISDAHLLLSYLRPTLPRRTGPEGDGGAAILAEYHRPLSSYLAAALPLGFRVLRCEEPAGAPRLSGALDAPSSEPLPTHVSWELMRWCPQAAAAAHDNSPLLVVWHFQLEAPQLQAPQLQAPRT